MSEMIERYIYAVTKHMKPALKDDVSDELKSIIQDMLEDRCGDGEPSDDDIRAVLSELGTPLELSQKYDEDSNNCLIGQPYYGIYKYVLEIVLICVAGGLLISQSIEVTLHCKIWYEGFFTVISNIAIGVFVAFGSVTLIFAIFYRKGIKLDNLGNSIDNLPSVPKGKEKIKKADAIVGIAFSVIFTIVFLVCPQIICIGWHEGGTMLWQPFFNLEYVRETWYIIVLFGLFGITRDSMKLIEGRYTKRFMIVTCITNALSIVFSCIWLLNSRIMNPDFKTNLYRLFPEKKEFLSSFSGNFAKVFLTLIALALLINTIETVVRTLYMNHKE
jgi:hypothetical protein